MKRRIVGVFVAVMAGIVFLGCQGPLDTLKAGSLTVNMNEQVSRTLLPGISMVPASYLVVGAGPNGATFSRTVSSGCSVTVPNLAFGDWTVTVTAKNSGVVAIGAGSSVVTVLSNRTVTANVTVIPYSGQGTLDLTVNWPAAQVASPSITSTLVSSTGDVRHPAFTVTGSTGKATFVAGDVSTGYHTLTLKLYNGSVFMKGAVEVVRIVKEQTTTGV